MSRYQDDSSASSNSEDPASVVAQSLENLQCSTSRANSTSPSRLADSRQPEHQITPSPQGAIMGFEIIAPVVDNPEDYEYLPGHYEADCVLGVGMQEPKFIVRLKSGERQRMTANQLKSLKYGSTALREFNKSASGSQSPDPLAMDLSHTASGIYVGGDGALDPDIDLSNLQYGPRHRAPVSYSQFFRAEDKDEDEDDMDLDNHRNRRSAQSKQTRFETDNTSDDEEDEVDSDIHRNRRSGRSKKSSFATDDTSDDEEDEEPPTAHRRLRRGQRISSRLRQTHQRNMKERLEDDEYPEREVEKPKQQRYTGAREQFRELPENHEFRLSHCSSCARCGDEDFDLGKGAFVFCQGCTASYHQSCLGERSRRKHLVTKVDEGYFILQCSHCLGTKHQEHDLKPHLGHCSVCRELGPMSHPLRERLSSQAEQQMREANDGVDPITQIDMSRVNNVGNLLIRCLGHNGCKRAFHIQHLPNSSEEDYAALGPDRWQCSECAEYLFGPNPIQVVVAWRPKSSDVKLPASPSAVELIPEIDKEYLIKWKERSYFHVKWVSGDWVCSQASSSTMISFFKSPKSETPIMTTAEAVPEENLRVDNVFEVEYIHEPQSQADRANAEMVKNAYVKFKGLTYEDSVWETPPSKDDAARWEDFQTALVDWVRRECIRVPDLQELKSRLARVRAMEFDKSLLLDTQPKMVTGGKLMDYQLDGVNWLLYMFFKKTNAILADDMGLGKTVQIITLFSALIEKLECFPFLVVVPNSTVPNWRREMKQWAPDIRVVTYYGSAFARGMAIKHEMFHEDRTLCCHVVIASYESIANDEAKRALSNVHWAGLVVDEGQRLKNDKTTLYERLCRMKFDFKVLLTGTPLQNNIRELFNLLQFIDPKKNSQQLEMEYGGILDKEAIRQLHDMIRPCLLRRTKAEVLPFLPPMVQIIIPISMSVVQKKLYKSILEKNPMLIKAICKKRTGRLKKAERHNLNNILMQLRKCLCHPFIYNRDIEEQSSDPSIAHQRLVEASGKLRLLNLMLPRLKERGNRVLIFSQFLENLDIVEDFLVGLGLPYRRLDGTMASRKKQQHIDQFNAPDSPYFAFLLSTRSGGVGINLATADTVIILDPDFNPKQDMQALSRAHRLGQKNTVLVFHLVVRASVEEKIMQMGKKKMALDHVLIDRMEADEDEEDLESILKHGAQALFTNDDSADVVYDLPSIDKLLDRSQSEQTKVASEQTTDSTKGTQFNFAKVWQKDRANLEEVTETQDTAADATAWEQILQEREREAQEEAIQQAEGLGRGKRKRGAPRYSMSAPGANDDDNEGLSPVRPQGTKVRKAAADLDADFTQPDDASGDESESDPGSFNKNTMDTDRMELDNPLSEPFNAAPMKDWSTSMEANETVEAFRTFCRIDSPPPPEPQEGYDSAGNPYPVCVACQNRHMPGNCPLRHAGVEYCGLCGLAHFGYRRVCPHLQSPLQISRMLEALDKSTEDPELVKAAKKYLRPMLRRSALAARGNPAPTFAFESPSQLTSESVRGDSNIPVNSAPRFAFESPYQLTSESVRGDSNIPVNPAPTVAFESPYQLTSDSVQGANNMPVNPAPRFAFESPYQLTSESVRGDSNIPLNPAPRFTFESPYQLTSESVQGANNMPVNSAPRFAFESPYQLTSESVRGDSNIPANPAPRFAYKSPYQLTSESARGDSNIPVNPTPRFTLESPYQLTSESVRGDSNIPVNSAPKFEFESPSQLTSESVQGDSNIPVIDLTQTDGS
ncbi:Zinc finger PHD-type [Penicillium sp. DV-2018c]|nr:Zinc finger PHD-type [Penicillium sp. DV-2018c]